MSGGKLFRTHKKRLENLPQKWTLGLKLPASIFYAKKLPGNTAVIHGRSGKNNPCAEVSA